MKKLINLKNKALPLVFFLLTISIYSCQNSPSSITGIQGGTSSIEEVSSEFEILTYGRVFMQPLDTLTSLNMAGARAHIFIDFIDEEYCNVLIYSGAGNVQADRKYNITLDTITFENPIKNEVKKYSITQNNLGLYFTSQDGIKWRVILNGGSEFDNLFTKNNMKRNAFLYPVLNDEERQFGAEDRFVEKGGRIMHKSHPLKMKARDADFFNQF